MAAAAIAEPAPPAEGDGAPGKRFAFLRRFRTKKKLLIVVGAALALVLAAGGGGAWYLMKKRAAQQAALEADEDSGAETASASAGGADAAAQTQGPPTWLPLDPFIVNLADRDADRYAQIGITLELETGTSVEQIKAYMPAVRNAILLVLASKKSGDLLDRSGKEQLADEIVREAARPLGYQIAAPLPVQEAAPAATADPAASAPSAGASGIDAKPKKKRMPAMQKNLIRRVHFSSFIVQ